MLKRDILEVIERDRTTIRETTGIECFAADDPDEIDRLPNT